MTDTTPQVNHPIQRVFDGHQIRVIVDEHGQPWFIGVDVARALGYADANRAVRDHCKGGVTRPVLSPGGEQFTTVIPERDVYRLVMRSRLPEAERFEEWVVGEVLPSIRRTGSYGSGDVMAVLADPAQLRGLLSTYAEKVLELQPKADGYDRLTSAPDTFGFQEACKIIHRQTGANQNEVRSEMFERGWIRRLDRKLAPAHYGMAHGYVTSRVNEWRGKNGETRSKPELRITGRGVDRLIEALMAEAVS